jgi:DNA-binding response OmpR family regulator
MINSPDLLAQAQTCSPSVKCLGTILVIVDDPRMQKTLQTVFSQGHYSTVIAGNGQAGLDLFRRELPAAVILDLMLPHMSGRELCKTFKQIAADVPVIVLSAISEVADNALLLEFGADDYVTKPFSPQVLIARVQAAIRRRRATPAQWVYRFGDCEVDFSKMTIQRAGNPVAITAHEFKLLRFFTENAERVLSRDVLLNQVWGYNFYPLTRTVDNKILKLRQKLEPNPTNPRHLLSVYGAGYKFVP